jgi:D-proline reductase (dithiol) PrdB
MGDLSEFQTGTRLFLKAYPWRRIDPVPWTPLRRPLAESKLALVSSAGFVMPEEEPFDMARRGGDPSFREIPSEADPSCLLDSHRSQTFDHGGMQRDANLAFPLDRVRELVASGRIGSLAPRHLSFMGGITAPGRLTRQTAPAAVSRLVEAGTDIALLVPV